MKFIKNIVEGRKLKKIRRQEMEKRMDECWFNGADPDNRAALGFDGAQENGNFYDHAYTNQIAKK